MNTEDLIRSTLEETGAELKISSDELVAYTIAQGARLSLASNEPGFDKALIATRNAIALKAGVSTTMVASAADSRLVGVISGVLLNLATL